MDQSHSLEVESYRSPWSMLPRWEIRCTCGWIGYREGGVLGDAMRVGMDHVEVADAARGLALAGPVHAVGV